MFNLRTEQILNAPIEKVFPFFATPENLEKITPSDLGFVIKTPKPLEMKKGAIFEYTIKLGFLRFPWITLIKEYDPPYMFQDIQRFGPYKKWEHTHEFISMGEKTKIIDNVDYDLYPKFISKMVNNIYIKNKVFNIFKHRKEVLNRIFNKGILS